MNFFLALVLTVTVFHFFCLLVEELFFPTTTDSSDRNKPNAEAKDCDLETERKPGFVPQATGESEESARDHKIAPQEISTETCGSPEIPDDTRTALKEIEIIDLTHESGEEALDDHGLGVAAYDYPEILIDQNSASFNHDQGEVGTYYNEEDDIVKERLPEEEDDWEGIESSKLERIFGAAVVFVASKDNADELYRVGSDLRLRLYGLHKVAIQGPCYEPQPMAFKVSARAKWNAWQQLGNMSPEVAMEKYVNLLTSSVPGWMKANRQHCQDERT